MNSRTYAAPPAYSTRSRSFASMATPPESFSAIECTGRREAKRLMTTTTGVGKPVSSRSELVSTGVGLPPRDAPSPSLYSTDDEVACLTGAKEPTYVRPVPLHHPCLLYTSPSPRDRTRSRMPSSA